MSSSPIGNDGKVYCKHMEEAVKHKSINSRYPTPREFYCCKRPREDKSRCTFFRWADELPPLKQSVTRASGASSPAVLPGSQPSVEAVGFGSRSTSVTRMRPLQEHTSSLSNSPETPLARSSKRFEDIQAGLRLHKQDQTPTRRPGPSQESGPAIPKLSGIQTIPQTIPQPPSPVPTEPDSEADVPRVTSFLGLYDSPEAVELTIKDEGQPSTPKKRRLTPPTEGTVQQPATPPGAGALITPPKTTRRDTRSDLDKRNSDVVRSWKGKEREGAPSAPNDWDEDDSGPSKTEEADDLPQFALPEDASTTASRSPTTAENVLDYTDGVKERVKALAEYMDSFDITQAGRTLQAMERQKMQYEYRDQFQKTRIEELVAENDRLAAEVTRLREALRRSEDNNGRP